ncbi:Telomerase catalytic subunit/reverse transcriptase TERT [Plasmopara halstedii]|uniref:Telomerase reverse transcriptase n=1 Tax=Plasmopara halstedii TaxID=4781 RepID=A0A0P1A6J1_PLAHL|nr:Telomerase catalytic subunit/reverse transcriptase TERT [Plasmopara halstedii]CEG35759.1 Telomerase catalytic subunit/reverse transcriptase TERT [Plasmopara halstedii]|eukprot:XP_024572128.1 Telomerase catalytic subunit/reverse transcriptase TERT [Plasmopara halstedii]
MEALLAKATSLRSYLKIATETLIADGDNTLAQNLNKLPNEDVAFALDHTFLIQSYTMRVEALPRTPWSCKVSMPHTELVHHVIERLLARKRAMNWEDANILTLGYREVTPEAVGHRVIESNGVMCYYPNTLVAALKKPLWISLHKIMGDDLMMHLLLNYTIFVHIKGMPDSSYMQLTGKSLRRQKRREQIEATESSRREVSVNLVMYARSFVENRVFASSHILVKMSKTSDLISRSEACRIIRVIFPSVAGMNRLPKRLVNLIPIIQAMVSRFKALRIDELARKLIPVNAEFCKFMATNPAISRKLAERAVDGKVSSQPIIAPILQRALDHGYLSQGEDVVLSSERKRKRREEAIQSLSNASTSCLKSNVERTKHLKKKLRSIDADREIECGMLDLLKLQQHKEDIKKLLAFATSKKKIYRLVRKLVTGTVPKELWGNSDTPKNWKHVKKLLQKLIFSRKFDVFSLEKCAEQFQVTRIEWMNKCSMKKKFCPPNELVKRRKLVQDLLWWVISSIVFPLLRNMFYITECEGMANEVAYYQRPVWNVISTLALYDLEGGILQPADVRCLPGERHLATSRLRLLPKASGVRPLMNLSRALDPTQVSVNRSMEAVHRVLTYEMERQPQRLVGCSIQNIDEAYKRLKPLFHQISKCSRCIERRSLSGDIPMAYCVTVDVERCFDTIRPRKLYQMLKKALQEEEYLIRKHWIGRQVAPIFSSSSNHDDPLPPCSFFFKLKRLAYPSGELLGFDDLATQSKNKNAVLVDGVLYDYLTKTKALKLLKEHLSANVVQLNGREFVQQCGIPQGSVLSTTLCNIYYAHFERHILRKHLPKACDPAIVIDSCCQHEELLRYTDDFLYITTDLKRAQKFIDVMHKGNEKYGCFANTAKSQANFAVTVTSEQTQETTSYAPKELIAWCGMLIEPDHLQVYVHYEKLSSSLLQGSIPLNETKAAQHFFVNKMLMVTAHRFLLLVNMLPFINQNMHFFHNAVCRILKKMTNSIYRNLEENLKVTDTTAGHRKQSSKRRYEAQKDQVWRVGLYCFQLTINAQALKNDGQADWQKLVEIIHTEQSKFKKRPQIAAVRDLEWLLHDRRNECVLQRVLNCGSAFSG